MEEKKRDMILTVLCYLLSILAFVWLGKEMTGAEKALFGKLDKVHSLFFFAVTMLVVALWFYVQIIFHEVGHFLAGLLTGFQFISFRIGSFTFVKENGRLQVKRMTIAGTGGQCLMCPPPSNPEMMEDTWYLLGGPLMNMLLASIGMYAYNSLPLSKYTYGIFFLGGLSGLVCCIMNLFPMKMNGMINDGYNIFITGRKRHAKAAMYNLLVLNAEMTKATSLDSLDSNFINRVKTFDYMNLGNVYEANLYGNLGLCYLGEKNYEKARQIYEEIYHADTVLGLFKTEAQCELLYHELIGACREEEIQRYYTPELQKYIKQMKFFPSKRLLMYAYYSCYKKDEMQATRELCELKALKETYPIRYEYLVAEREAERIKERTAVNDN